MRRSAWLPALLLTVSALGCGSPTKPTPDPYPTGPHIACPSSLSVTSSTGLPLPVTYGTATAEGGEQPVTIACTPPSGSTFSPGTTPITCTATDARQRIDTCAFDVVVLQPPRIRLTRFLAFGDSITLGENGLDGLAGFGPLFVVASPYPTLLRQLLSARYSTQSITVTNAGERSELASEGGQSRLSSLLRSGNYDVVLIMEGSNDLGVGAQSAALNALRSMVQESKGLGVSPFLATIPPMDGSSCCPRRGSAAPLVPGFNDGIRALAASEGVPLVDVYAALNANPGAYLSQDGLHPNDAGYERIANVFFEVIRSALEISAAP